MKRYRAPSVFEGQIKVQRGRVDGCIDMCIFYGDNTPRGSYMGGAIANSLEVGDIFIPKHTNN